ncbi:MAG: DUF1902 domain-containing protein [Lachnospiraceae bacterium]|nr:DUF1902 domain-containing protein [Lachnospiraceae bacterium]
MEYVIQLQWDNEAGVWIAINDYIPLTLESESLDELMRRVREAIPEIVEMNQLNMPKYLHFFAENREEIPA